MCYRIVVWFKKQSLECKYTSKVYDEIIALKNEKITESGIFAELIAPKGYFYALYTVSQ